MSQTLNVLIAIRSREPTSHMLISPTFVPTTMKIAVSHITEQQQNTILQIAFSHHFLEKVINKIGKETMRLT